MQALLELPSSPNWLVDDRFSILEDSQESEVPFWSILKALLDRPANSIRDVVDLLDTIAHTLEHNYNGDYNFLAGKLRERPSFIPSTWSKIVKLLLDTPKLFPHHSIPVLTTANNALTLSRAQVACLVCHQFIGSLKSPSWFDVDCSPDFHIWYNSYQPHEGAVSAYLDALFGYFERLEQITLCTIEDWPIIYRLQRYERLGNFTSPGSLRSSTQFCEIRSVVLQEASTGPNLPLDTSDASLRSASVISANRMVGFGRTGTQEEVNVGSSPEACPVNLLCPPLDTEEVLIVVGAEPVLVVDGYGRSARSAGPLPADLKSPKTWKHRTMLFMDALELDNFDGTTQTPDLLPGHLARELRKAFTAFNSHPPYDMIHTGRWGCRSFCGNEDIKTIIQWSAASFAGVGILRMIVTEADRTFISRLQTFKDTVISNGWTVELVLKTLNEIPPTDTDAKCAFEGVVKRLSA